MFWGAPQNRQQPSSVPGPLRGRRPQLQHPNVAKRLPQARPCNCAIEMPRDTISKSDDPKTPTFRFREDKVRQPGLQRGGGFDRSHLSGKTDRLCPGVHHQSEPHSNIPLRSMFSLTPTSASLKFRRWRMVPSARDKRKKHAVKLLDALRAGLSADSVWPAAG